MAWHHVNFHTLGGRPVFEQGEYDEMLRSCLRGIIREQQIVCMAWEVMPTHVHMLVADFTDSERSAIVHRVKGATSRAFFLAFPELRADLLGGHLWSKGYFAVLVRTHQQFCATVRYIRANREHADLPPPEPLAAAER